MAKKRKPDDDEPKKKRRAGQDADDDDDAEPKSKTMLVLVGVGALLLCCCGAGGIGGGGFLFRDRLFATRGIADNDGRNKDAIARDARPGDKDKIDLPDEWTPSFKLAAADLTKEVVNNSKAASDKYNGKLIELTGTVREAKFNTHFSIHGVKNPKDSSECIVFCNVYPSSVGDIKASIQGQQVRVQGKVFKVEPAQVTLLETKVILWDPVKKVLPEMTMNITVDEWVREWEKDTFAFNRNYGRKMAIVTGVVEGTSRTPANEVVVQLRSPSKTRVFVTFREAVNVNKGQNIQFRVTFQNFNANGGDFRILGDKFLK
jgi:putative nucleic acid binding protein